MTNFENSGRANINDYIIDIWGAAPEKYLSETHVGIRDQLISKSREPAIKLWTPNDAIQRFSDVDKFEEWSRAGKLMMSLMGRNDMFNELQGQIWFGRKPIPEGFGNGEDMTFAIRLYESAMGRGLAKPFMERAHHALFNILLEGQQGVWLDVNVDNEVAHRLYESFGYIAVGEYEERRVMTYHI